MRNVPRNAVSEAVFSVRSSSMIGARVVKESLGRAATVVLLLFAMAMALGMPSKLHADRLRWLFVLVAMLSVIALLKRKRINDGSATASRAWNGFSRALLLATMVATIARGPVAFGGILHNTNPFARNIGEIDCADGSSYVAIQCRSEYTLENDWASICRRLRLMGDASWIEDVSAINGDWEKADFQENGGEVVVVLSTADTNGKRYEHKERLRR